MCCAALNACPNKASKVAQLSRGSFLPLSVRINTETLRTQAWPIFWYQRRWIHPRFFDERFLEPVLSEVGVFRHDELEAGVRVPWCSSTASRRVAWLQPGRHQRFALVWHGLRPTTHRQSAREVYLRRLIQHEEPRNRHVLLPGVVVLSGDVIRQPVRAATGTNHGNRVARSRPHRRYENKN